MGDESSTPSGAAVFWGKVKTALKRAAYGDYSFVVLMILIAFLITPIYLILIGLMLFEITVAEHGFYTSITRYYSISDSYEEIWNIVAPILIAFSAGASLKNGVKAKSAFLFVLFFVTYISADVASTVCCEPLNGDNADFLRQTSDINVENLKGYIDSIATLCITAIAIVLGLASAKVSQ